MTAAIDARLTGILCAVGASLCFSYISGEFVVKDAIEELTPGIMFIDDDLWLSGIGTYTNTFIATGDIRLEGTISVYAPNYAGYDSSGPSPIGICDDTTNGSYYPTNLCDTANTEYIADFGDGVPNFALMAGSLIPSTSNYQGGDVDLQANVTIFGNILAGDRYSNSSNITIYGLIGAEGNLSSGGHTASGRIGVDMRNLPATFVPMASMPLCANCTEDVTVFWSRYL